MSWTPTLTELQNLLADLYDDVDVRPDDAFKDRRRRLPREGIRTPLPTEVIEEPIAAGNPKLIAKQAVTTGGEPGTEGGQGRRRRCREAALEARVRREQGP